MDDLIEIKSVSFSKNPCETGEEIILSVDVVSNVGDIKGYTGIGMVYFEEINVNVQQEKIISCLVTESGSPILTTDGKVIERK